MNAHTFYSDSANCPICRRRAQLQPTEAMSGLLICRRCQEKLVMSGSGHYVRDPFTGKQNQASHLLRRQSRPWSRAMRDFGLSRSSPFLLAILGTVALAGMTLFTWQNFSIMQQSLPTSPVSLPKRSLSISTE